MGSVSRSGSLLRWHDWEGIEFIMTWEWHGACVCEGARVRMMFAVKPFKGLMMQVSRTVRGVVVDSSLFLERCYLGLSGIGGIGIHHAPLPRS